MENVVIGINRAVHLLSTECRAMSESEISQRPRQDKWSKKEIVGHLCDSALNNIERFVKIQYAQQPYVLQSYDQEQWVVVQNYQSRPFDEILDLFQALNKQITTILENIPTEKLSNVCDIGDNCLKTLTWLIQDYLEHMEHHINNQILRKNNE